MKSSLSTPTILHHFRGIANHFAITTFVLAMLVLIYCVFSIQQIFELPTDQTYYSEQQQKNTRASFDKKTIDQVKRLRTVKDTPVTLPPGRINPFIPLIQ